MKVAKFGLLVLVAILGFALLGSSPASAFIYPTPTDTITLTQGLGGAHGGGEFNVAINGSGNVDFITFCLEGNEEIFLNHPYLVGAIADVAILGGVGVSGGGLSPDGVLGVSDPLDPRTAFLYTAFTNGTLAGFNYSSATDANDLQAAIWFIEDEPFGANNNWVTLANAAAWTNLGDVGVINPINDDGKPAQSVLTRTPVPEPSMMLLFGSGMLGLAFAARKRFFKK